jgi:hypothetical protein
MSGALTESAGAPAKHSLHSNWKNILSRMRFSELGRNLARNGRRISSSFPAPATWRRGSEIWAKSASKIWTTAASMCRCFRDSVLSGPDRRAVENGPRPAATHLGVRQEQRLRNPERHVQPRSSQALDGNLGCQPNHVRDGLSLPARAERRCTRLPGRGRSQP